MRITATQIFVLIFCFCGISQIIFDKPLSNRTANYNINAHLDTKSRILYAYESLKWKNTAKIEARELQLHLYLNAFKSDKSTFLSDISRRHRRFFHSSMEHPGRIDINSMILNGKHDLTDQIEFIRPDDGNVNDSTVIRVPLPEPLLPGDELVLEIAFTCRLPRIIARTGYVNDFYLIGQWFPKIGVFIDGKWNCHQFFPNSEFFADFGVYEVELTLPVEYTAGSTGLLMSEWHNDSLQILHWRAEDVHDFAITAWPRFRTETRRIAGIVVTLMYAPEHRDQVVRYFRAIEGAILYLNKWLMPYPYPSLILVDPPLYAFGAAGMEYPCFITCGSVKGLPDNFKLFPEEVTIHEYAHQYFYGMLASNEAEEPWLDEGFTSYAVTRIMSDLYGKHRSAADIFGILKGDYDRHKESYMKAPDLNVVLAPSWDYNRREYGIYTYDKPVLILYTLENFLGRNMMDQIMRNYQSDYKFKHPGTADFIRTVNETAGRNMNDFFRQALQETLSLDYSVDRLSSLSSSAPKEADKLETQFTSETVIRKRGGFIFPVEIKCVFSRGDTLTEHWNGEDSLLVLRYNRPDELISVWVDPETKVWLDLDWINNSLTVKNNKIAFYRHWLKSLRLYQQTLLGLF